MRQVEFFTWIIPNANPGGKPRRSAWKMSAEVAKRYPGAVPDPKSRELREVAESPEEQAPQPAETRTRR